MLEREREEEASSRRGAQPSIGAAKNRTSSVCVVAECTRLSVKSDTNSSSHASHTPRGIAPSLADTAPIRKPTQIERGCKVSSSLYTRSRVESSPRAPPPTYIVILDLSRVCVRGCARSVRMGCGWFARARLSNEKLPLKCPHLLDRG